MHEAHEAARAVAALLDLAAVGVEDAVAEVDVGAAGFLDQQDLVAADAEMAVGDAAALFGRERDGLADAVEHDEVVAEAVHFGEFQFHALLGIHSVLSLTYSLSRQRSITTVMPAACARSAAASCTMPSWIQIAAGKRCTVENGRAGV